MMFFLVAVVIDVVNSKKTYVSFSATSTFVSISTYKLYF